MADQQLAILLIAVIRIEQYDVPWVAEARTRLFERHTVLVAVDRGLHPIPYEIHATRPDAPARAPTVASVIVRTCSVAFANLRETHRYSKSARTSLTSAPTHFCTFPPGTCLESLMARSHHRHNRVAKRELTWCTPVHTIEIDDCEWDTGKARDNLRKYGVHFVEAAGALLDPCAVTRQDPRL
jgi:uncharacterized DUF497 family protein